MENLIKIMNLYKVRELINWELNYENRNKKYQNLKNINLITEKS